MRGFRTALMVAGVASLSGLGPEALGQPQAQLAAQPPTYQRNPVGVGYPGYANARRRFPAYRPRPFPAASAQVASGTFQRPYPYHLDYYRQRYGGGYEPYLGNLYGPPAVVGTQPFALSEYPAAAPVGPRQPGPGQQPLPTTPLPPAAPGGASSPVVCPHCGQLLQLQWQPPR